MASFAGDAASEIGGDRLQDQRESSSVFEGVRVHDQLLRFIATLPDSAESSQPMNVLRQQTQVPHDWNSGIGQRSHDSGERCAALDLHGFRAAVLHQPPCISNGIGDARVIGEEGQIGYDERPGCAVRDRAAMMNHHVQRDADRRVVAEHDHAEGVANQQNIDSGAIHNAGHGGVIRRQHGDLLRGAFHFEKVGNADLPALFCHILLSSPEEPAMYTLRGRCARGLRPMPLTLQRNGP